ncbi:alpha/beta hydrolase [Clostridium paridis]|uniref:Alpha/beta hydrolase n=1 Tax=Clostridium paridis TaxID=2803863 RepID=A0A937FIV4_9CLOT|nr:alpha/beta hydrolase [Clostridium paridis]MBL4933167.1 alpha/beta hydrolase [Clostridium paridis]
MVERKRELIDEIPALIWGPASDKVYIYVHGKMGRKENAEHFAEIAIERGYQVISFDLPEHGERKNEDYPIMAWNAVKDLKCIREYVLNKWKYVNLYACSLGVYFSLLAYNDMDIKKALFQCPVLNMERLIFDMMKWFNIEEERLKAEKEIATPMGETLSWDYLTYSKEHPVDRWKCQTYILYPSEDKLTPKEIVDEFKNTHSVNLTVLNGAEHYFTEKEYLDKLEFWLRNNI